MDFFALDETHEIFVQCHADYFFLSKKVSFVQVPRLIIIVNSNSFGHFKRWQPILCGNRVDVVEENAEIFFAGWLAFFVGG